MVFARKLAREQFSYPYMAKWTAEPLGPEDAICGSESGKLRAESGARGNKLFFIFLLERDHRGRERKGRGRGGPGPCPGPGEGEGFAIKKEEAPREPRMLEE